MDSQVLIRTLDGDYVRFKPEGENGFETLRPLPRDQGQGHFTTLDLAPGLNMGLSLCRFETDYRARITWTSPMVVFGFGLSGRTLTWSNCKSTPVVMDPGQAYVHYFKDPTLVRETSGGNPLKALVIRVSPSLLSGMLNLDPKTEARELETLGQALENKFLFASHAMTAQMKTILFQIFNCPHQGVIRKIYFESKAMELIACKLEQVIQNGLCSPVHRLAPGEEDRILTARDLLINRLQFPPSLPDLARQVGMSHPRLNRGFRRVFGCTVFEYLRRERLNYARMLMEENRFNLTQVAFEAGFCSSSHFATAFLRQFGVRPSEYCRSLGNRGNDKVTA
ncbi:MAG: AraC family transcriptional regulator [Desulfobacterales bacterium]|nr:AraC family transcriptional regulator [Desulfobacterales bacterium]